MIFGMADDGKILFDMNLCGEGWRRHYRNALHRGSCRRRRDFELWNNEQKNNEKYVNTS